MSRPSYDVVVCRLCEKEVVLGGLCLGDQNAPQQDGASFIYTNHRSVVSRRSVIPIKIYFQSSKWYPESTWLLHAWDLDRNNWRDFALSKIGRWETDPKLKVNCGACGHRIFEHYSHEDENGVTFGGCLDHVWHGNLESKCFCVGMS